MSAAHSTVDLVSFGWPALGLLELNFVTLVPAKLGFPTMMLEKL
jgi:hypothetical protein